MLMLVEVPAMQTHTAGPMEPDLETGGAAV
jgi:hypothetical protein